MMLGFPELKCHNKLITKEKTNYNIKSSIMLCLKKNKNLKLY